MNGMGSGIVSKVGINMCGRSEKRRCLVFIGIGLKIGMCEIF